MATFITRAVAVLALAFVTISSLLGQALTFTTLAGPEGGVGFDDGVGRAARFSAPAGLASDRDGNIYVADQYNNTIRKVTPSGAVTTLAGLAEHSGSADGVGAAARFNRPTGIATDIRGNVYVADADNFLLRKITPEGAVTTLAALPRSKKRPNVMVTFFFPFGVATDGSGNVYVADTENCTILKIASNGEVITLAGSAGENGYADGSGSEARFSFPFGLASDRAGNLYVADVENYAIRKVTPAGVVSTLAGGMGPGPADGTGRAAHFSSPFGVAADSAGNVYVSDSADYYESLISQTIRKITPAGEVTTLAGAVGISGASDGAGAAARFRIPIGIAADDSGNVYVADALNSTIRRISPVGDVSTLAGLAGPFGGDDGERADARFAYPAGVATDTIGNVYVADQANHTIRKIAVDGLVTTLAGLAGTSGTTDGVGSAARFQNPAAVAVDGIGNIYVADQGNRTIRKITPAGVVTTFAGVNGNLNSGADAARFLAPIGLATDVRGNLYVSDLGFNRIRKITPAGVVSTLQGPLNSPRGLTVRSDGTIYVAEYLDHVIRTVTPSGAVSVVAGAAGLFGNNDGKGSAARFREPVGLAGDDSGNLYVADQANSLIRKVTADGEVTTAGGVATGFGGSADGTGSGARFFLPSGLATDQRGNVYVADSFNHKIRVGRPALADVASIDAATGPVDTPRRLGTTSPTATSWQWTVIRRPANSTVLLSSQSVRNPTFTPDVPGLFTFRLVASAADSSSITTVDLNVTTTTRRRAVGKSH